MGGIVVYGILFEYVGARRIAINIVGTCNITIDDADARDMTMDWVDACYIWSDYTGVCGTTIDCVDAYNIAIGYIDIAIDYVAE